MVFQVLVLMVLAAIELFLALGAAVEGRLATNGTDKLEVATLDVFE